MIQNAELKTWNAERAAALIYPAKLLLRKSFAGALVAAEQISQAAVFLAALLRCSLLLFPKNSLRDFFGNAFL